MHLLNRVEILKSLGIGKGAFYNLVKEAGLKPYRLAKSSNVRLFDMDAIYKHIEIVSEGLENEDKSQYKNMELALAVRADILREKKEGKKCKV